jgi:hypothetical protein
VKPFAASTVRTYSILVVAVFTVAVLGKELFDRGLQYSCWNGGYQQNAWMAYCNTTKFGVYDLEAIWYEVEPEVTPAIAAAAVLTLSDSHLQSALSLGGASEWFAARNIPLYMLGLPGVESAFGERLIDKFDPHPAVLVLDASPYFTGRLGSFEGPSHADPSSARKEILKLREFQSDHQWFCGKFSSACGRNFSYFRSRRDGRWIFPQSPDPLWYARRSVPTDKIHFPAPGGVNEQLALYPSYRAAAERFLEKVQLPRDCVVITNVPSENDLSSLPQYLADATGMTVVNPTVRDLHTFDHSHLSPDSSRRWTQAFLRELEPIIDRCMNSRPHASGTAG